MVARVPLLLLAAAGVAAAGDVVELGKDNFDSLVFGGKNAFVKFFAPWCGHCKSMKPAWDKLGTTYKDSSSVLIGDVDCTDESSGGKAVCDNHGVTGFPTIKYFTSETGNKGEKYQGGRDYDGLEKFVKEKLAKKCNPQTKEDCDDQEKAYIEKQTGKDASKLKAELSRLQGMKGGDMKADKRAWINKRIAILAALSGEEVPKGEL